MGRAQPLYHRQDKRRLSCFISNAGRSPLAGHVDLTSLLFQSDKSNTLHVTKTGSGGLTELIPLLEKDRASFAFVRVKYANDE